MWTRSDSHPSPPPPPLSLPTPRKSWLCNLLESWDHACQYEMFVKSCIITISITVLVSVCVCVWAIYQHCYFIGVCFNICGICFQAFCFPSIFIISYIYISCANSLYSGLDPPPPHAYEYNSQLTVFVCSPGNGGVCEEWAMIELQGELETRHPVPLSGKLIGDLHFTHAVCPHCFAHWCGFRLSMFCWFFFCVRCDGCID